MIQKYKITRRSFLRSSAATTATTILAASGLVIPGVAVADGDETDFEPVPGNTEVILDYNNFTSKTKRMKIGVVFGIKNGSIMTIIDSAHVYKIVPPGGSASGRFYTPAGENIYMKRIYQETNE